MNNAKETSNNQTNSKSPWTDQAAEAAHKSVDNISEHMATAETRIRDTAKQSVHTLSEKGERLQKNVKNKSQKAHQLASDNPLITAGIAFAAGMLVTSIIRRKNAHE